LHAKCPSRYYKKVFKATLYTGALVLLFFFSAFASLSTVKAAPCGLPLQRLLVIPVEFPDQPHVKAAVEVENLIFGRVSLYLSEASYGKVRLEGVVLNWVEAPRRLSFYGCDEKGIDWRAPILVKHAVHLASKRSGINVGEYNLIIIVHAGQGQETSRRSVDIWSAYWTGLNIQVKGSNVDSAVILPEYEGNGVDLLGPYVHEILHALGLQDVGGDLGKWDVMGRGAYYGDPPGSSPAHPSAYNKIKLGWMDPSNVRTVTTTSELTLSPLELTSNHTSAVKIPLQAGRYYLVELRDRVGFDQGLPSPALMITLVEEGEDVGEWKVHFIPLKDEHIDQDDAETAGKSLILPLEDKPVDNVYFADPENRIAVKGQPYSNNASHIKIEVLFN
jgi:M6 family metalloprotease-like protein